ncbi:MAG TPA: hypothetical protein VF507_00530 [Pyrinomonadaceae bacterium]
MTSETSQTSSLPAPPAFNGWAVYGWMWALAAIRILHGQLAAREAEIERLREEKTQILNRLLRRQSTEPLPTASNGNGSPAETSPPVRRHFKPPIASHVAAAQAKEDEHYRQARAAAAQRAQEEEHKRAAIRADAQAEPGETKTA